VFTQLIKFNDNEQGRKCFVCGFMIWSKRKLHYASRLLKMILIYLKEYTVILNEEMVGGRERVTTDGASILT